MDAHASVAIGESEVELDSIAYTCVVGDNCKVIYDHYGPVNVYSYERKNDHRSANTVNVTVGYQDPQCGQKFILIQKFILMIYQAIHI